MKRLTILSVLLLTISLLSGDLFAFGKKAYRRDDIASFWKKVKQELNLTSEQRGKIEAIEKQYMEQMKQIMEKKRGKHRELMEKLKGASPDEAELNRLADEIAGINAELLKMRVKMTIEYKKVLDEKQREKFDAALEKMPYRRYRR